MKYAALALLVCLSACASSGVVPTGPDSYMLAKSQWGFTSGSVHKARLAQEAAAFCQSQGKTLQVTNTASNDVSFGKTPGAEVQFRCVSQ